MKKLFKYINNIKFKKKKIKFYIILKIRFSKDKKWKIYIKI
jgi:hypothetical protein